MFLLQLQWLTLSHSVCTDSLYLPVQKAVEETRAGSKLGKGAMAPRQFAHGVVSNAVKQRPQSWFWYGSKSTLVWLITTFFPHTFLVSASTLGCDGHSPSGVRQTWTP